MECMGISVPNLSAAVFCVAGTLGAQQAPPADPGYTAADVHFMQGMIGHHAQAIVMSRWAPSHGASEDVAVLASRIIVSQRDEIASMRRWLTDHHEVVPDTTGHMGMDMPGMKMDGDHLMPGMLTPEQMAQLDAARGEQFDKLFLLFMIRHHQGALSMVNDLFESEGAGQEEQVFKFASDVSADQTAEIDRMARMLATLHASGQ
jgi:uncharacterized protein (DUF305 family)